MTLWEHRDFETVCVGPVDWDLAHAPTQVVSAYPGTWHSSFDLGTAPREVGVGAAIGAFLGGAGAAFGALADPHALDIERTSELPELGGELLVLAIWFLFGACYPSRSTTSTDLSGSTHGSASPSLAWFRSR